MKFLSNSKYFHGRQYCQNYRFGKQPSRGDFCQNFGQTFRQKRLRPDAITRDNNFINEVPISNYTNIVLTVLVNYTSQGRRPSYICHSSVSDSDKTVAIPIHQSSFITSQVLMLAATAQTLVCIKLLHSKRAGGRVYAINSKSKCLDYRFYTFYWCFHSIFKNSLTIK